jgi:hypothetical protein
MIEVVAAIAVGLALDCFSAAFVAGACWERVKTFTPSCSLHHSVPSKLG